MQSALSRAFQAAISLSAGGLESSAQPAESASLQEGVGTAGLHCTSISSPPPQLATTLTKSSGGKLRRVGLEAIEEENDDWLKSSRRCSTDGVVTPGQGSGRDVGEVFSEDHAYSPAQAHDAQNTRMLAGGGTVQGAGSSRFDAADRSASPVNWLLECSATGSQDEKSEERQEEYLQPSSARQLAQLEEAIGSSSLVYRINSSHVVDGHLPLLVPAQFPPAPRSPRQQRSSSRDLEQRDGSGVPGRGGWATIGAWEQTGVPSRNEPAVLHQVQHQCVNPVLLGQSEVALLRMPDEP